MIIQLLLYNAIDKESSAESSEIAGLRWRSIHSESITVEQRYCRGDWSCTKTPGSAATIAVDADVIARIHRLKTLTVDVRAGRAVRRYKVVKADGPDELVFQSVKDGKPMNDENVLKRHITPAARRLGFKVTWRSLRTSCATWMVKAGADPKSVQGQMRHSRISTTMDIYAQFVPGGAEASGSATQRIRSRERWSRVWSIWSVTGPITRGKSTVKDSANPRNLLRRLVELVGIEPTASSLRTTRSPS
jgi:integrase